ncbi:MAG: helix-turn-helix transcriptional regulator [Candidatus Omnitrophica bacterium]|nr:helix-turn-helix transcriptional regulator [Elusimicrobiota bacterium]MBI4352330.1 helix-turn-helix transcriptional regulator [Candidatus Omnitrophota bacterium]
MKDNKTKIKQVLVQNIKKYRAGLKLTQEQAAEKADITLKYWQRLEMTSQTDLPSLPTLSKIAKALEVQGSDLLRE